MSGVMEKQFAQFYDTLVGDELARTELLSDLSAPFSEHSIRFDPEKCPYERLEGALSRTVKEAANRICGRSDFQDMIKINGLFANEIMVETLRTVGNIYRSRADEPQEVDFVLSSTNRALGMVYSLAKSDEVSSGINLTSYRYGVNPRSRVADVLTTVAKPILVNKRVKIAKRTFRTTVDDNGQVIVSPRYSKRGRAEPGICPATFTRIEEGDGTKSALLTFMKTVGEAAVRNIYPTIFPIQTK